MSEFCPLIKQDCLKHGCKFYTHITGTHPQTGAAIDQFDCAVSWMPVLLIENANEVRKNAASVQSFRNLVAEQNKQLFLELNGNVNH